MTARTAFCIDFNVYNCRHHFVIKVCDPLLNHSAIGHLYEINTLPLFILAADLTLLDCKICLYTKSNSLTTTQANHLTMIFLCGDCQEHVMIVIITLVVTVIMPWS